MGTVTTRKSFTGPSRPIATGGAGCSESVGSGKGSAGEDRTCRHAHALTDSGKGSRAD